MGGCRRARKQGERERGRGRKEASAGSQDQGRSAAVCECESRESRSVCPAAYSEGERRHLAEASGHTTAANRLGANACRVAISGSQLRGNRYQVSREREREKDVDYTNSSRNNVENVCCLLHPKSSIRFGFCFRWLFFPSFGSTLIHSLSLSLSRCLQAALDAESLRSVRDPFSLSPHLSLAPSFAQTEGRERIPRRCVHCCAKRNK